MGYITIKASCPTCGDISTSSDVVAVRILESSDDKIGQYRFLCPVCKTIVLKDATTYVLGVLMNAGIKVEYYSQPLEIMERPREDLVPPITLDDMIDLHEWLEELEKGSGS